MAELRRRRNAASKPLIRMTPAPLVRDMEWEAVSPSSLSMRAQGSNVP